MKQKIRREVEPRVRRKKRAPRVHTPALHIAVVVRNHQTLAQVAALEVFASARGRGDWAAFVGTDLNAVIHEAEQARQAWGPGQYEIWTGPLTGRVVQPKPNYSVKVLK